ncbi:type II secretion system ATPase GspE [Desulfovibrio sp. TomC]|uniref:type II secretion system ATPase GspE n=1 Tax=Desulfovibrio sp. TomC TaxID=1562888 RepID=UPI000575CEE8|nr:type II secretion system ATPase GspE [Desulfovibrio sp. TomC]KHK01170.1 Type IV fimbrial assembly, ATPase PilB [Desulfovibrio sp. TomC]
MALPLPEGLVPKTIGDRLASLCRLPVRPGRDRNPGVDPASSLPRPALLEPVAETLGLTVAALEDVFAEAARSGHNPFRRLAEVHKADPAMAASALAKVLGLPYLETIPATDADAERMRALPFAYLKRNLAVPFTDNGRLVLALADPFSPELADDVRRMLGVSDLEPALALPETILAAINHAFGQAEADGETRLGDVSLDDFMGPPPENMSTEDLLDETSNAPVIRLVNQLLTQAVRDLCSDIHIEPYQNSLKIRFRLDGVLYDIKTLDKRWHPPVVSHVKIRAKLDIAERRLPQDGSFDIRLGNRNVDIRVSVFPTKFGERLVLRLLEKNSRILSLEELGLSPPHFTRLKTLVTLPHGIILVTGPTGSGKSTTLYGIINHINSSDKNILTIEDPVEYQIEGVGQMQVNAKIDLTFASGLRSILRQDPDVILVGEIRDAETAQIACQAALTGHLVFSTLHTNDAASAVTRMVDMGIEPYMVCSVVRALIAQRLVRVLCTRCREAFVPSEEDLLPFGPAAVRLAGCTIWRAKGCPQCMHTGFRGRTSIHELLVIDESMADLILHSSEAGRIRAKAIASGMTTLREDGLEKILSGITTIEEVIRATVV